MIIFEKDLLKKIEGKKVNQNDRDKSVGADNLKKQYLRSRVELKMKERDRTSERLMRSDDKHFKMEHIKSQVTLKIHKNMKE